MSGYELVGYDELIGDDYDDYGYDYEDELEALLGAGVLSPRNLAPVIQRLRQRTKVPVRRAPAVSRHPTRSALTERAMEVAEAVKRVDEGTLLRKTKPTKSREYPIGFDSVSTIAAGATATLTQRPQIIFRPERIIVPASVAAFFLITDIKIGKDSQLVSAGSLPAATFSETAFGVRLKMDTVQISQDLILTVENIDGAAHRFLATMIGESVE